MAKRGRPKKKIEQYDILKWRIKRYDELNWVLEELVDGVNPRTKEPCQNWKVRGYFGRLEHLFDHLLDRHLVGPKNEVKGLSESIEELLTELRQTKTKLVQAFEKIERGG